MANTEININNYSDDSKIKSYIRNTLVPRVFNDIPLNVLNAGSFSLINEYMSQALEQLSFTSAFYFNESFITKAVLPDSIYSEAAIFNIGYSFASPSSCNFLLELRIDDIYNNSEYIAESGLYQFILDKDTKFNLSNGNVYSLDYDILIQYMKPDENSNYNNHAWNVQYTNMDDSNSIARNKQKYILYRVTNTWLCLFVTASEYERTKYTVINNVTNNIPNEDKVITCNNHICGFDIKYIDNNGNETWLDREHILPIHSNVNDNKPYVHYIMDNPQTIRFMFQLDGTKYFVPDINSSFEIIIYTCHGEAANFNEYDNTNAQPSTITASNKYSNNANVMKASFVLPGGSLGGTNIGSTETVRRETIEAYNTANVISSDHDIDEWFKTFYFKNILYPFFFKRRDDPWCRIWSGYLSLKDDDDYVYRTNTLHANCSYQLLYNNNDNTVSSNEIIIPPGWLWTYGNDENNNTVLYPYTDTNSNIIETARSFVNIKNNFVFSNPFGIRIQKEPFAIGYFNPWINTYATTTPIERNIINVKDDPSYIYHATPIVTQIKRTYLDDFYRLTTYITPTIPTWIDNTNLVKYSRNNAVEPVFASVIWNYFSHPLDMFAPNIPMLPLDGDNGFLPYDPEKTFLCVRKKNQIDDKHWSLEDIWIQEVSDETEGEIKDVLIPIIGNITGFIGDDSIWGNDGLSKGYEVYVSGITDINVYPSIKSTDPLVFTRIETQNHYELRIPIGASTGIISKIVVSSVSSTTLTRYGEQFLNLIGEPNADVYLNIYYRDDDNGHTFVIKNASRVFMPYNATRKSDNEYEFDFGLVGENGIILYAEMKPSPEAGAIDYYRVPFSLIDKNSAMFYIANKLLPVDLNNMRVILHAYINGSQSGYIEMQPVSVESDGSYYFEACMYPLNELVDMDNRINIASTDNGGGSWIPSAVGSVVNIDATNPEFKISILIRSNDATLPSEIIGDDSYTGFRIVDQYTLDDIQLVQELKEMRSVVKFGDSSIPSELQMKTYTDMIDLYKSIEIKEEGNIKTICDYAYYRSTGQSTLPYTFADIHTYANKMYSLFVVCCENYLKAFDITDIEYLPIQLKKIKECLFIISINVTEDGDNIDWEVIYNRLYGYINDIKTAFSTVNIDGGLLVELVPFVEYSLMTSNRFESFVSSFTNVHKSIEPVIMTRLEGNNYLDCKLIATYGRPHSYIADINYGLEPKRYWPDLNIQIEFDVMLYNKIMATNTIADLRSIIKSYFNRITTVHTPVDMISMDNNIYISHIIQQMEEHTNVAYLKFKGFYTNQKGQLTSNYMDANVQSIMMAHQSIDEFTTAELEDYTPEMFILEDDNIQINVL